MKRNWADGTYATIMGPALERGLIKVEKERDEARKEAEDYRDEAYELAMNGGSVNEWRRNGRPRLPWEEQ